MTNNHILEGLYIAAKNKDDTAVRLYCDYCDAVGISFTSQNFIFYHAALDKCAGVPSSIISAAMKL